MSFKQNVLSHPRLFYVTFMLEIWERFGYTSVISILAVFFVKRIGLSEANSFILFGAYSALIYSFIALGGYIGDHVLGAKRTIILGLIVLLFGYLLLGFGDKATIYFAMSLICTGTGLFKSNPSNLLAKCYKSSEPEKIHNAFTMFYMAINIGALAGLFLSPIISVKYGFKYSFIASSVGILLAIVSFLFSKTALKEVSTEAGAMPLNMRYLAITILGTMACSFLVAFLLKHVLYAQVLLWAVVLVVVVIYLSMALKQQANSRNRMFLAVILMVEAVVFQVLYMQMPTSINFFAINNVTPSLLGLHVTAQSFQSLNPFWIIILSPVLSHYYIKLKQANVEFSIYSKFSVGMLLCGLAFLVLFASKFFANNHGMVSSWWLVLSYFLQSSGELMIAALGVAMVAELVPTKITGFVMGMWFVFLSMGNLLGGYVASAMALPAHLTTKFESIQLYTHVFLKIGLFTLFIAACMFSVNKYKKKLFGVASEPTPRVVDEVPSTLSS